MGMFAPITWSGRLYKWLYFTALLELVLAAVFLVIGLNNDILRGGFTLTAAFLGLTGMGLFLWGRRWAKGFKDAQRLRTSGVPGQATIQGCVRPVCTSTSSPDRAEPSGPDADARSLPGHGS